MISGDLNKKPFRPLGLCLHATKVLIRITFIYIIIYNALSVLRLFSLSTNYVLLHY